MIKQKRWQGLWLLAGLTGLFGCEAPVESVGATTGDSEPEVDERPVVRAEVPPPPLSGGTLLLIDEGEVAVAADPDRNVVYVASLGFSGPHHTIELSPGDEPGRLAADAQGRVHVATRGTGKLVTIDPHEGTVLERRSVCPNPRGVAYDPALDEVHVACSGGELVTLPAIGGPARRRVTLPVDLRDVWVTDQGLAVSRLRAAEVLYVDEEGNLLDRHGLPTLADGRGDFTGRRPAVAWRTRPTPSGDWLMLHQFAVQDDLVLPPRDDDDSEDGGVRGGGTLGNDDGDEEGAEDDGSNGGYSSADEHDPCAPVVNPAITLGSSDYTAITSGPLGEVVLPVDIAISDSERRVALAVPGGADTDVPGIMWLATEDFTGGLEGFCREPTGLPVGPGQFTSVEFDPQGRIVAFSREPAKIVRVDPWQPEAILEIEFDQRSVADTGHDLFHRDAGGGLSCASCHPEGGDDGHIWRFLGIGSRHTPALAVGLRGTEPFHWEGDLADMGSLMNEVHRRRMKGTRQSEERIDALAQWMFDMPQPQPPRAATDPAAERGAVAFEALGCATCHLGPSLDGGERNVDVGYGLMQIPPLRRVALHPPFFHDGRASDLRGAVLDMALSTRPGEPKPPGDQIDDVVAYLESL